MLTDKEITVNTASTESTDPSRLWPVCHKDENKAAVAYVKDSGEIAICTINIPVVVGMADYILPDKKADIDEWCSPVKGSKPTSCKSYVAFFTFTDPTNKLDFKTTGGQYGWYDHYSIISFTIASDQSGNYQSWSYCHPDYGSKKYPGDFMGNEETVGSGAGPLLLCPTIQDHYPEGTAILDSWQNPKNIALKFVNGKTGTVHVMEIHP